METDQFTVKLKIVQKLNEFRHVHDGSRKLDMVYFLKMPKGYITQMVNDRTNVNWLMDRINEERIFIEDLEA